MHYCIEMEAKSEGFVKKQIYKLSNHIGTLVIHSSIWFSSMNHEHTIMYVEFQTKLHNLMQNVWNWQNCTVYVKVEEQNTLLYCLFG